MNESMNKLHEPVYESSSLFYIRFQMMGVYTMVLLRKLILLLFIYLFTSRYLTIKIDQPRV